MATIKQLMIGLVLPLVVVFGLAIILHIKWPAGGFFLNLSTEIIGILITVCYVEWILRRHERQQWSRMDAKIADRLRILLNANVNHSWFLWIWAGHHQ
jgi:hypothetical protein